MARRVQYYTNEQRDTVIAIVDDSIIKKVRFTQQDGYHSIKADKSKATFQDINKVRDNYRHVTTVEHYEEIIDQIVNFTISITQIE